MDIEAELINNDQSVRLLQIMIDTINSRSREILDEADVAKIMPNLVRACKQTVSMVRAMPEDELKQYKEWRNKFLNRVMDSTFDYHFSF